jgi:fructokinase
MPTKPLILAIGEVLWDIFPDGPRFGGAPANFACACAELARKRVHVQLASAIGTDKLGDEARQRLLNHGVDLAHLQVSPHLTGQVLINLDEHGRASYRFLEDSAWDHLHDGLELVASAKQASIIHFGTLGQRSATARKTVRKALMATSPDCKRILDINLRAPHWSPELILESLPLANVLKLNDEELPIIAEVMGIHGTEPQLLHTILKRFSLQLIALTRGDRGSFLLSASGESSEESSKTVSVVNTVGAGDAFVATLALGLLQGYSLSKINRWASRTAAYVCTQPGATPSFPTEYHLST